MKHTTRSRLLASILVTSASFFFAACDRNPPPQGRTGIRGVDKFDVPGPEPVVMVRSGICTLIVPPLDGTPRPAMAFGGSQGSLPTTYSGILERVASFGTIVTAANTASTGSGNEISACIDQLDQMVEDFNGSVAAVGHLDGGSGAINASRINDKVEVTCPITLDGRFTAMSDGRDIEGSLDGPALILCATNDTLATCTAPGNGDTKFQEALVPITRVSVDGASLFTPTGDGGLFPALVTTCVEAALGGDAEALAALRPSGLNGARGLSRIATRNQ